jgi:hypothetical protein
MRALARVLLTLGILLGFVAVFAGVGVAFALSVILLAYHVHVALGILVGMLFVGLAHAGVRGMKGILSDLEELAWRDARKLDDSRFRRTRGRHRMLLVGVRLSHLAFFATVMARLSAHLHHSWWLGAVGGIAASVFVLWAGDEAAGDDDFWSGVILPPR